MGLVVFPFALIDISIGMDEPASTVGPVVEPVTFIQREIFPDLFSFSVPHAATKLANVPNSTAHIDRPLRNELRLVIIVKLERPQPIGNLLSAIIVKVLRLQIVVIVHVQNQRIFALILNAPTSLTLSPHS